MASESGDARTPARRGPLLLGAAFVALCGVAGWLMLAGNPAPPQSPPAATGKPVAAAAIPPAPKASASPADERFVIRRILPIEGAIKYGDWHWNEAGAPSGPIVVTVDLEARVISVFRSGYEIGAAAVLVGSQEKPTPLGVFPITEKQRHHVSNLYDAPMPYMQRLTNDGISLHATTVEWGYASHGCIGMPEQFASRVFAATHVGDRVFITRGKMVGIGDSLVDS
jgi:lipoprotein-anchoring transpeptidase ErfK/SrfK